MAAKRASLTSESSLEKCGKKRNVLKKDQISELPDEILVSIVSQFNIKEAARTSVLSHRWENLWTCISSLNFDDASETLANLPNHPQIRRQSDRLDDYARWMNQALKSHQAPILEEFRICVDVTNTSAVDIDSWIGFAIKKRVQRLELDFSTTRNHYQRYGISADKFCFASFKSLTTLCVKEVNFAQELFEDLLSNSPLLEHLCVHNSGTLVNFKVAGPSCNLKYLEISYCSNLETIEISALYLESFKYSGQKATILFKEAPQLIEVLFQVSDYMVMDMSRQLSRYLSQLRKIVWSLSRECVLRFIQPEFPKLPTLSNLRHLELLVRASGGMDIHPIMSFLEASPSIHRFKFEIKMAYFAAGRRKVPERKAPKVTKKHPYPFLKVVELIGFIGDTEDVEIAMYLLENAVSLKKLIISPFNFGSSCMESEIKEREKQLTRECAIMLGTKLPPGAEFLML